MQHSEESSRLRVDWRNEGSAGRLEVKCEPRMVQRYDTCADFAEGPPTASQVWTATGIKVVETDFSFQVGA